MGLWQALDGLSDALYLLDIAVHLHTGVCSHKHRDVEVCTHTHTHMHRCVHTRIHMQRHTHTHTHALPRGTALTQPHTEDIWVGGFESWHPPLTL